MGSMDYNEGKNDGDDGNDENVGQKEKLLASTITSQSKCKGAIISMSFHVLSVDEVRMYLHINGQTIRFFPNDIIDVLPLFFDDTFTKLASISNKEFPNSDTAKKLVNQMMINLKD